jgi:hypothetical protein
MLRHLVQGDFIWAEIRRTTGLQFDLCLPSATSEPAPGALSGVPPAFRVGAGPTVSDQSNICQIPGAMCTKLAATDP